MTDKFRRLVKGEPSLSVPTQGGKIHLANREEDELTCEYDVELSERDYTSEIKIESSTSVPQYGGTPATASGVELPTNSIAQNSEKSTASIKNLLENRVSGDDLLNAQDLISDVRNLGAEEGKEGAAKKQKERFCPLLFLCVWV